VSPVFKKLWKSKCLHKQKVFVWIFLVDRLNTRDMMDRRQWHLDSGFNCVMCSSSKRGTRDHLFFNCSFARKCWSKLRITWSSSNGMTTMFEQQSKVSVAQNSLKLQHVLCEVFGSNATT
jgi:hypothetical protein